MKLITRVITATTCAAAALLFAPAAASASYPAETTNQSLHRAQLIVIKVPANTAAHDAVQMAVAIAFGASVATAVRRRRQPDADRRDGFLQRVPTKSDVVGDVLVKE